MLLNISLRCQTFILITSVQQVRFDKGRAIIDGGCVDVFVRVSLTVERAGGILSQYLPVYALGVRKTSSFGATRTTSPN
jgi:hypothetical protein